MLNIKGVKVQHGSSSVPFGTITIVICSLREPKVYTISNASLYKPVSGPVNGATVTS